jgi:hypothetical protein
MAILGQPREAVDEEFGSAVMAKNLIGGQDYFKGERAYEYDVGDFIAVVGYYSRIARYVCFRKQRLAEERFTDEDVQSCLALATDSEWKSPAPVTTSPPVADPSAAKRITIGSTGTTTDFNTTFKDANGKDVRAMAWHRTTKPYVFAYCPTMTGQKAVAASPIQIDKNFGQA